MPYGENKIADIVIGSPRRLCSDPGETSFLILIIVAKNRLAYNYLPISVVGQSPSVFKIFPTHPKRLPGNDTALDRIHGIKRAVTAAPKYVKQWTRRRPGHKFCRPWKLPSSSDII